ncbi:MAG: EAL domain-containing protein, partial [Leptospiraceae bacterium]|nr:EAL domain-containing protein [Leptospiraceae bacterium]
MNDTLKVLIVEDNPVNARLVGRIIETAGDLTYFHAETFAQATDILNSEAIDVVLLDLHLPDGDGLETLTRMRAQNRQLAIVVLSGLADEEVAVQAVKSGAQDYIFKDQLAAHSILRSLRYAVERNRIEEALRASEERYALATRGVADGVWDWNLESNELFLSDRWKAMIGYEPHEVRSHLDTWLERIHPDDRGNFRRALDERMQGGDSNCMIEYRLLHRDGQYRWMMCRGATRCDERGMVTRIAGSQTDITDLRLNDLLTGLPNRQLFYNRLSHAITLHNVDRLKGFAVLWLNIDRFSAVNESLGIAAGDRILIEIAERLRQVVWVSDTVARIGGDEFLLLLEDVHAPEELSSFYHQMQDILESPVSVEGREFLIKFSVGAAFAEKDTTVPELMQDVRTAMLRAKELGGNRLEFFQREMTQRAHRHIELETLLRKGLERDELQLFYQPKLCLQTNRIVGFEALLRWFQPEQGLIPPDRFIPLAEQTDLIQPVGEWVVSTAFDQIRRWRLDGLEIPVAINISARQFKVSDVHRLVQQYLEKTGIPANLVEVEFTESVALSDLDKTVQALAALRELGVTIAIDDFGTGYSSLTYLRKLP